ncbi:unnamed protein product [Penicillium pancosmium]
MERRHSDTSVPQSNHTLQYLNALHPHYAIIYLDQHGKPRIESSSSYAESSASSPNDNIFIRPDVTEQFMKMIPPNLQSMPYTPNPNQAPISPWSAQSNSSWMNAGPVRPAEMIPCEWQTSQNRRKRQRPTARDRPKSTSPPPTAAPCRTVLRVGDRDTLRKYYAKAFEDFQQLNCRAIAKSYVKLVEPRKQVHFPYNGRKVISGVSQRVDPELTKPGWWPEGVCHKEPDHLLKIHSHGITAEKLCEAGQDVRRQITPASRLEVLDEIYFVRQMEEQFIDGEIDANTLIQVFHTQLPDSDNQDGEGASSNQINRGTASDRQAVPLSPATSDSSGPHSPTNTSFNAYPVNLGRSEIPQEAHNEHKPLLQTPNYLPGYFPQHFVPADKPSTEYWPNVPPMPDVSPYGY